MKIVKLGIIAVTATLLMAGAPDQSLAQGVPVVCLLIDEDSIDNGTPPNFFNDRDINDDIAAIGLRSPLRYFRTNVGKTLDLWTGEYGDEGWFRPELIPVSWRDAGPTFDGLDNFFGGSPGPGLGTPDETGNDPEVLLDKIPEVVPLREPELNDLVNRQVFAVVYDSDISINYNPLQGNLKGANLGVVAFQVLSVTPRENPRLGFSSSSLPKVEIRILDATDPANQC